MGRLAMRDRNFSRRPSVQRRWRVWRSPLADRVSRRWLVGGREGKVELKGWTEGNQLTRRKHCTFANVGQRQFDPYFVV